MQGREKKKSITEILAWKKKKKKEKRKNTFFGRIENIPVFFQKSSRFSSSPFNPILYIDPISIKRIHQDVSFSSSMFNPIL